MLNELINIINPSFNLFGYLSFRAIMAFVFALLISFLIGPIIIRTLKNHQIGEMIRKNGPQSHLKKEGTPTMGGMIILFSVILPTILFSDISNFYIQIILVSTLIMGIVGLADDYLKVIKKYSKGLIARYKLFAQISIGIFVSLILLNSDELNSNYIDDYSLSKDKIINYNDYSYTVSEISIPFLPDKRFSTIKNKTFENTTSINSGSIELGILFFILLSILVVSGSSNSINLTDGLDGLAAGLSAIVFFTLGIISYATGHVNFSSYLNITYINNSGEIAVFCMAMVGSCLGFLWYNTKPAEIFMGDTGSLSLGTAMGIISIILKKELLLVIIAGSFVIESLSVILQVTFFKYSRWKYGLPKKFFLMAPLHHHFELKGIKESKIVTRFWIMGILFALLGLITLKVQ
jgi:phospho-N-acetylmuramoyl-pentapeptide-transferase